MLIAVWVLYMASNAISGSPAITALEKRPSLSLFSDLTPKEQEESRCQSLSCIVSLVLGICSISLGLLSLTLLPELTVTFIGIACVAIGTVLLITGISLGLAIRLSKRFIPPRISIRDLQDKLRHMLEARTPSVGEPRGEDALTTIREKEVMLATFDKELREQERSFYALLSQEAEDRHQLLFDLSELREIQERVSSELGALYSCYGDHSVIGSANDQRLLQLESDRNLLIQQIVDLDASRSKNMEVIEELREKLKVLSQQIRQVEQQIGEEESLGFSESKQTATFALQDLLQERNHLLSKLADGYNKFISSSSHQQDLMQQRLHLDKAIQSILDMETATVLLKRDYKSHYFDAKFVIQRLREDLQSKESAILALTQEVDRLSEAMDQLKESFPLSVATIKELQSLREEVESKKKTIEDLQEKITNSKNLLREIGEINARLEEKMQQQHQDQLLIDALERQQRVLEKKIHEQKEQLDCKLAQERALKEENTQLRDTMYYWESEQVHRLTEELAQAQKHMQALEKEKRELLDNLHLSEITMRDAQEKIQSLVGEMLLKDNELMQSRSEVIVLRDQLSSSEEEVSTLKEGMADHKGLLVSYQSLQKLVSRLENDYMALEAQMRKAIEQNLAAAESSHELGREKERLLQELQELSQRYHSEVEQLNQEKTRLEEEALRRYLSHAEEVVDLQSINRQLTTQLQEAFTLAEGSEEGALRMLASQLISYSPYIKEGVKEEIKGFPCDRLLAFVSPRFFGCLGAEISCSLLRPGVNLEEEGWGGTEEEKRVLVRNRCFREWLFALLGHFSFDQVQALVKITKELVRESVLENSSEGLSKLENEFPALSSAIVTLKEWLEECYPYITHLPIFNSSTRWRAFLFELLQNMCEGPEGAFGVLLPKERAYFQTLSYFSGNLPLVLGSIGGRQGIAHPLGSFAYSTFKNVSWDRVVQAVKKLLHIRSLLDGPELIDVHSVSEVVFSTISIQAYLATLSQRYSSSRWKAPKDL